MLTDHRERLEVPLHVARVRITAEGAPHEPRRRRHLPFVRPAVLGRLAEQAREQAQVDHRHHGAGRLLARVLGHAQQHRRVVVPHFHDRAEVVRAEQGVLLDDLPAQAFHLGAHVGQPVFVAEEHLRARRRQLRQDDESRHTRSSSSPSARNVPQGGTARSRRPRRVSAPRGFRPCARRDAAPSPSATSRGSRGTARPGPTAGRASGAPRRARNPSRAGVDPRADRRPC